MKTIVDITLRPDELAELFISMDSVEQAHFINLIGEAFNNCDFDAEMQCCYIADTVNKDGRDFLYTVSNFVKVAKFNTNSPKIDMLINHYPCNGFKTEG